MNYPVNAKEVMQALGKTTNGDFGHWFNAAGTAISYGSNGSVYAEFTKSTKSALVGQYPGANTDGSTRTIREVLRYIDASGKTAKAYLMFNITFKAGTTAHSRLSEIDYVEPVPTAVNGVKGKKNIPQGVVYDLNGRKIGVVPVSELKDGTYIIDGIKVRVE
jgi:hypothetical protein